MVGTLGSGRLPVSTLQRGVNDSSAATASTTSTTPTHQPPGSWATGIVLGPLLAH